jgi:hypothetical protein
MEKRVDKVQPAYEREIKLATKFADTPNTYTPLSENTAVVPATIFRRHEKRISKMSESEIMEKLSKTLLSLHISCAYMCRLYLILLDRIHSFKGRSNYVVQEK